MDKMRKYNNTKVVKIINGETYTFDSKAEYSYFLYLKDLLQKGTIGNLILQPTFEVAENFRISTTKTKSGMSKIGAMKYTPDFQYIIDGKVIVVEVKGMKTESYTLRKKLFLLRAYRDYEVDKFIEVFKDKTITYDCSSIIFNSKRG